MPAVVQRPQLGPLVLRIPLSELVAVGEEALLGACLLLVAASTAEDGVEAMLPDRIEQADGLEPVATGPRAGLLDHSAGVDRLLHRGDDQVEAELLDDPIAELDDLVEVLAGVDVHD